MRKQSQTFPAAAAEEGGGPEHRELPARKPLRSLQLDDFEIVRTIGTTDEFELLAAAVGVCVHAE